MWSILKKKKIMILDKSKYNSVECPPSKPPTRTFPQTSPIPPTCFPTTRARTYVNNVLYMCITVRIQGKAIKQSCICLVVTHMAPPV